MTTIPFLDLIKVNAELGDEIQQAVSEVIASGWYILGKAGERFENNLKLSLTGEDEGYAVGCGSGTDALILSLLAAGVQPADEVITVSHTAIPTVTAICTVGARPVFMDVDCETWVMDVEQVGKSLTPKTGAVLPVHLYGNMVDIKQLKKVLQDAGRADVSIVEDVAQAQGASQWGEQAGTLGRFGAFSFYPSKNVGALGDGGAIFSRQEKDMVRLKMLRNYGQNDRYHSEIPVSLNSRLDEIQAALLDRKLKYLRTWNARKAEMMSRYRKSLANLPLTFQQVTKGCHPAWHLCVIALKDREKRDDLMAFLQEEGIQTLIHYPFPNHKQKAFEAYHCPALPVTDQLADRILSLPLNPALAPSDQDEIISAIRHFLS